MPWQNEARKDVFYDGRVITGGWTKVCINCTGRRGVRRRKGDASANADAGALVQELFRQGGIGYVQSLRVGNSHSLPLLHTSCGGTVGAQGNGMPAWIDDGPGLTDVPLGLGKLQAGDGVPADGGIRKSPKARGRP